MKRIWAFALVAALAAPAFAQELREDLDQYKDEVNSAMGTLSERLGKVESKTKLTVKGDVRVRHEYFTQAGDQDQNPIVDGINNRGRTRIRARIGIENAFNNGKVAVQLATGNGTDPTSTNQTLGDGSSGAFNRKDIWLDQAFIVWSPGPVKKYLTLTGGKFPSPLKNSAINWDGDINPDGIMAEMEFKRFKLRSGYWLIDEQSGAKPASYDDYVWPSQLEIAMPKLIKGVDWTFAVGYLFIPTFNYTKALFDAPYDAGVDPHGYASGDSGMIFSTANEFHNFSFVDFMLEFKTKVGGRDMNLKFHTVRNTNSFDLNRTTMAGLAGTGGNNNENAYLVEWGLGKVAGPGTMAYNLRWGYIEPNGSFGSWVDSDPEYNNRKYLRASISRGLTDKLQFDFTSFAVKRVNDAVVDLVLSPNESHQPWYRFQFDFVAKL